MKQILGNRKLQLTVLAITIIIYHIFIVWSIVQYRTYVIVSTAEAESWGIYPPGESHLWVSPHGYMHFWYGKTAFWTGFGLVIAGVLVAFAGATEK